MVRHGGRPSHLRESDGQLTGALGQGVDQATETGVGEENLALDMHGPTTHETEPETTG
jgi:hypothetical protein